MSSPLSQVLFNAREQVLSEDLNRLQRLVDREVQNILKNIGFNGVAVDGTTLPLAIAPVPASFDVTVSAGDGFVQLGPVPADDSDYQSVRWPTQVVTGFAAPPGPGLARIDLIVATVGTQQTDLISRNQLVDPALRTVASVSINKTQNPLSPLAIVPGVASATPLPPAAAINTLVLFEVWIPNGALDASGYKITPRAPRLNLAPSGLSGVQRGCRLTWGALTAASIYPALVQGDHTLIIDDEVVGFTSGAVGFSPVFDYDGNPANDPNTVVNPSATAARPFYIYLCGGRHFPQATGGGAGTGRVPVQGIFTLVPPDADGRPSAAITTPRGVLSTTTLRKSAVYIGLGYTQVSSTNGQHMVQVEDAVFGGLDVLETNAPFGAFPRNLTLGSRPNIGGLDTLAYMDVLYTAVVPATSVALRNYDGATEGVRLVYMRPPTTTEALWSVVAPTLASGVMRFTNEGGAAAGDGTAVLVKGYQDGVRRLG